MPSIFSRIVAGEIPCHKVYEDDEHFAFLDINPIQPGHTLVIPKAEVDYLFDLSPEAYDGLWRAVRTVEAGLKKATNAGRVVVVVVGWEVPHVHIHLIPTNALEDFPIPPKVEQSQDEFAAMAENIRAAL